MLNMDPRNASKQSALDVNELARVDRVHVSLYTDPTIFDQEMKKIFYRTWVFV